MWWQLIPQVASNWVGESLACSGPPPQLYAGERRLPQRIQKPDNERWQKLLDPSQMWLGSIETLCAGFAHVLAQLEATRHMTTDSETAPELGRMLQELQIRKLGLDAPPQTFRYFEFSGFLATRLDSMEGIDVVREVFRKLSHMVRSWSGQWVGVTNSEELWWDAYAGKVRASRASRLRAISANEEFSQ